jgi:peptidyl-prolyl cis-trans isomerase SurA
MQLSYIRSLAAAIFLLAIFAMPTFAQGQPVIDEVVAVVGSEPILHSEIEVQLQQIRLQQPESAGDAECWLVDQFMVRKLMLWRARMDSLKVGDDQVENEMDRRMQIFVQQFGSESRLEEYYNKSIPQLKNELREMVREQLLIEQQQNKVEGGVVVSPHDVTDFFNEIPKDSLPYYNTELELSQIVIYPKPGPKEKQAEIDRLKQIRADVLAGKSTFSTNAILYSEDPGSSVKGGNLGMVRADQYVPEFSAAALSLKKDSISGIVETKYGYHIIKLLNRRGDMIDASHILRIPKTSLEASARVSHNLDSIRAEVLAGKTTFDAAAYKYSEDEESRNRGGVMVDPGSMAIRIPMDRIDAELFKIIDDMKPGDISQPVAFRSPEGKIGYRIVYLKSKTAPHRANMKEDYARIAELALAYKKQEKLQEWVDKNIPNVYIHIDPSFDQCENLARWHNGQSFMLGNIK